MLEMQVSAEVVAEALEDFNPREVALTQHGLPNSPYFFLHRRVSAPALNREVLELALVELRDTLERFRLRLERSRDAHPS
jgi:hypothetical protein